MSDLTENPVVVRQDFHTTSEEVLNSQINLHLYASYDFLSKAYYFKRDNVALLGFSRYFQKISDFERERANALMDYHTMRGGYIQFTNIGTPERQIWGTALEVMNDAFDLEKKLNENLCNLSSVAAGHNDLNLCSFIETRFLHKTSETIKELADYINNMKRINTDLGVFILDQKLQEK